MSEIFPLYFRCASRVLIKRISIYLSIYLFEQTGRAVGKPFLSPWSSLLSFTVALLLSMGWKTVRPHMTPSSRCFWKVDETYGSGLRGSGLTTKRYVIYEQKTTSIQINILKLPAR